MPQHTVYLFYAPANHPEAEQLQRDLQASNVGCVTGPTTSSKVEQLSQDEHGIAVLLVSDNYLKHLDEMNYLSSVFEQVDDAQLMPVITHGRRAKEDNTGQTEVYATNIGTLNDVMRYRDYWYEEWITLRKQYKVASENEQATISGRKEIAKNMSVGSISNHIRHINKLTPLDWDAFCANEYDVLLKDMDTQPSTEDVVSDEDNSFLIGSEQPTNNQPVDDEVKVVEETIVEESETETEETSINALAETLYDNQPVQDKEEQTKLNLPIEEGFATNNMVEDREEEIASNSLVEEGLTEEEETERQEAQSNLDLPVQEGLTDDADDDDDLNLTEELEEARIPVADIIPLEDVTEEDTADLEEDLGELDGAAILEKYDIKEVDDIDTLFHIAEAQLEEDDTADARHTYERILSLDPYNGRALIWLARLLAHHEDSAQPQEAADLYRKAIMINDDSAQLYYEYGLLQQDAFQAYSKAVDAYREALSIDTYYEDAYFGLAHCLRELGQHEAAKANYLQACLLDAERFETAEHDNHFDVLRYRAPEEELPAEETPETEGAALEEPINLNADQVVLVTGATSGIGRAIASRFIMDGYKVILAGRRSERLTEIKDFMENHLAEAQVHTLVLDVRQPSAVKEAIQNLPEGWNNIDILVNNAGLAKGFAPIHEGELDHWETMIDTNLKGLLYVSRAVTPGMVERGTGHIINIGSVAGVQAYAGGGVYCATKAAVDSLTRSMRLDLYQHSIKVTAVHPGHVENTEFAEVRYDDAEKANIYEDFKPLAAKDVADTVYYIATRPEHVNIQNVLLFGTQQASATDVDRSGREDMVIA